MMFKIGRACFCFLLSSELRLKYKMSHQLNLAIDSPISIEIICSRKSMQRDNVNNNGGLRERLQQKSRF